MTVYVLGYHAIPPKGVPLVFGSFERLETMAELFLISGAGYLVLIYCVARYRAGLVWRHGPALTDREGDHYRRAMIEGMRRSNARKQLALDYLRKRGQ